MLLRQMVPPAKKVAHGTGSGSTLEQKVDIALKLSVISTANQRLVNAIVSTSLSIPVAGEPFKALEACKASYIKMTKGKKGHGKAPPDVYNFIALLLMVKTKCTVPETLQIIDAFISGHEVDSKRAKRDIRACRTEKMFDSAKKRLTMSAPAQILEIVTDLLVDKFECEEYLGARPAGFLESEGQRLLQQ